MAKVLIDIPEDIYTGYKKLKEKHDLLLATSEESIANGIVLDNLSNGEAMQKIFPNAKFYCTERLQTAGFPRRDADFDLDWWNRKWGEA